MKSPNGRCGFVANPTDDLSLKHDLVDRLKLIDAEKGDLKSQLADVEQSSPV